jgi:hypothetical protein
MVYVAYFYEGVDRKIFKTFWGLTNNSVVEKADKFFMDNYKSHPNIHFGFKSIFHYIFWIIKIAIIPEEIDDDESIIEIEDEYEIPD